MLLHIITYHFFHLYDFYPQLPMQWYVSCLAWVLKGLTAFLMPLCREFAVKCLLLFKWKLFKIHFSLPWIFPHILSLFHLIDWSDMIFPLCYSFKILPHQLHTVDMIFWWFYVFIDHKFFTLIRTIPKIQNLFFVRKTSSIFDQTFLQTRFVGVQCFCDYGQHMSYQAINYLIKQLINPNKNLIT